MKMSVMANRTLSHFYNISVTDYQTGESNTHVHTHTHTNNVGVINRSTRRAPITLKAPDNTDLEMKKDVLLKTQTHRCEGEQ